MSTFEGFLSDPILRFIAIDYFKPSTHECSSFLLSHVHWDHLQGIFDHTFISLVNDSADKFLYCSTFTAHLLTKFPRFNINKEKIVAMEVNKSFIIRHKNLETDVAVTCLAAGHCPGSVMFLLEYLGKRILYTGDFRIRVEELKKVRSRLTNNDGSVIPIDELYLDTTFAARSLLDDFPPRESSEKLIIEQIERWMKDEGQSLKITISLPYRYGIEYLYVSLSKRFNKPISVHDYNSYAQVEEIVPHVVSFEESSEHEWFIHACMRKKGCPLPRSSYVKIIRPCAMNFLNIATVGALNIDRKYNVPFDDRNGIWRVFYSSHCSLKELQDVVQFLQPNKIFPNVRSDGMSEKEITDLLRNNNNNNSSKCIRGAGDSAISEKVLCSRENVGRNNFVDDTFREETKRRRLETMKKFNLRF